MNEASGPSKQASNLAGRLACKQVSKRARQSGKPGKQTGKLAASETQREKRKRGHMTSRMRRGWVREEGGREGIDRTTRTVREYIPQHGSIRRRRRYMELDQTGGERGGRVKTFRGVPVWRRHRCVAVETCTDAADGISVCELVVTM